LNDILFYFICFLLFSRTVPIRCVTRVRSGFRHSFRRSVASVHFMSTTAARGGRKNRNPIEGCWRTCVNAER
jgi:hypothetical protein